MKQRRKVAIVTLLSKYATLAAIKDGSVLLFSTNKSLKTHTNTYKQMNTHLSIYGAACLYFFSRNSRFTAAYIIHQTDFLQYK